MNALSVVDLRIVYPIYDISSTPEEKDARLRATLEAQAKKSFSNWKKHVVDWESEFPRMTKSGVDQKGNPQADLVKDMMKLDMGKLYRDMEKEGPDGPFGLIPLMASGTRAQIGALMAKSFCERVISQVNLIMDDGNTLLKPATLEKLTVLHMNRDFMEFMRKEHPDLANQVHRRTVVEADDAAPSKKKDKAHGRKMGAKNKVTKVAKRAKKK